jgi:hypothetical protein
MKDAIILSMMLMLSISTVIAQVPLEISGEVYEASCNNPAKFSLNGDLKKTENTVSIKTKKWTKTFTDSLVEEEDVNMKLYEPVGIHKTLGKAIVRETGLTETKYLLVDLRTKKVDRLNAMPTVSKDLSYLVCISEPDSDTYLGLEAYSIKNGNLKLVYKENDPKFHYLQETAKWCDNDFVVQKRDHFKKTTTYIKIRFAK